MTFRLKTIDCKICDKKIALDADGERHRLARLDTCACQHPNIPEAEGERDWVSVKHVDESQAPERPRGTGISQYTWGFVR